MSILKDIKLRLFILKKKIQHKVLFLKGLFIKNSVVHDKK